MSCNCKGKIYAETKPGNACRGNIATPEHGKVMGSRGRLHAGGVKIVRPFNPIPRPARSTIEVLTPASTVRTIAEGYQPYFALLPTILS